MAAKAGRVRGEQRGDPSYRSPHQHLVAEDDANVAARPPAHAALGGRGEQGEVARAGDGQEDQHGDDKRAVIGDPEHAQLAEKVKASEKNSSSGRPHWLMKSLRATSIITGEPQA